MIFSSIKNFIKKPLSSSDSNSHAVQSSKSDSPDLLKAPHANEFKNNSASTITKKQSHDSQKTNEATANTSKKPPVSSLKYPELKNKYKLIKLCGEGASSKVYKAYSYSLGTNVAIKITDKSTASKDQLDFIKKEISIMKKLNHKNIVKMYDHMESESTFYIILEYCSGGEIFKEIIRFTYFSEELARHVILQVAHAVKYLHQEIGVAHRDIKPENLLFIPCEYKLRPDQEFLKAKRKSDTDDKIDEGYFTEGVGGGGIGIVKLADFGLSKVLWNTTTQTPCGTAGYTAPEIVKVEKYDKSVDLWAIGCVLYTLLCGFPPFYDDNNDKEKLLKKNLKGEYKFLAPWWDEISSDAKKLVSNLLNIDPLKRYTIDQLLNDPWMLKGEPTPLNSKFMHQYEQPITRNQNSDTKMGYFPVYIEDVNNEKKSSKNKENTFNGHSKDPTIASDVSIEQNSKIDESEYDNTISSEIPADIVKKNSITAPMVHDEEHMINKEKKYKHIFNKNMEYQRENIGSKNSTFSLHQLNEDDDEEYEDDDIANSIASSVELSLIKKQQQHHHNQTKSKQQSSANLQSQHPSLISNTQPASILLNSNSMNSSISRKLSTNTNTTSTSMSTCNRKLSISENCSILHRRSTSNLSYPHSHVQSSAAPLETEHGSVNNLNLDLSRANSIYDANDKSNNLSGAPHYSSSDNLADSLSSVSFKRRNTLPRTPLPKETLFTIDSPSLSDEGDDNDYDDEDDEDEEEDEENHNNPSTLTPPSNQDKHFLVNNKDSNASHFEKALREVDLRKPSHSTIYIDESIDPKGSIKYHGTENDQDYLNSKMLSDNIQMSLDNFCLDMNNSSMLERRRKSSVNIPSANITFAGTAEHIENKDSVT